MLKVDEKKDTGLGEQRRASKRKGLKSWFHSTIDAGKWECNNKVLIMLHIGTHWYEVKTVPKLYALRVVLGMTEYVDENIYGKLLYCD